MHLNLFLPFSTVRGRKGLSRRVLGFLGPSWVHSPVRRAVQTAALGAFVALLVWVCTSRVGAVQGREVVNAEIFLKLDPLAAITAAVAARAWVVSLWSVAVLLGVCLIFPRGFCAYVCPLGTLVDLSDRLVGKRLKRLHVRRRGWWVHLRFYVLVGVIVAALCGVMLSGFLAAIPLITRAFAFVLAPLQTGLQAGWGLVPPVEAGQYVAIALLIAVLALAGLGPRFWCRCLCPTGAVFSVFSLLRLTRRQVAKGCIQCGRCIRSCEFGAVRPNFATRSADCTFCQSCGGACPTGVIRFEPRFARSDGERPRAAPKEVSLSRRGFIAAAPLGALTAAGVGRLFGAGADGPPAVRPPGSLPEKSFLGLCVRCGSCLKVCPTNTLQPLGLQSGLEGLWTPAARANWAGCHPECNNCGQVCPTGAIRALPLAEKRVAHMGRAVVDEAACLPHRLAGECDYCYQACEHAGYHAIEFIRKGTPADEMAPLLAGDDGEGLPVLDAAGGEFEDPVIDAEGPQNGTWYDAPVVRADVCVGCGLCQARCRAILVEAEGTLDRAAITIQAGEGKEDRIAEGSYLALREAERTRARAEQASQDDGGYYVP